MNLVADWRKCFSSGSPKLTWNDAGEKGSHDGLGTYFALDGLQRATLIGTSITSGS